MIGPSEKPTPYRLRPDVAKVITEIAESEGVSIETLVAEWISERAIYEKQAKARG